LIGVTGLAVIGPVWFLAGAAVWAVLARRRTTEPGPADEAAFLRNLAGELAAGASLRGAVVTAAAGSPALGLQQAVRLAAAGMPADRVGTALGTLLPVNGVAAAAAFRLAASTGGRASSAFESLAVRADEVSRLAAERRALTAQARLSAWIVGGGPVALVVLGLSTGRGPGLAALGPVGILVVGIGLALIGAGALAVWLMVRRAGR
jgi:Flp pilus assembly protein TadB